MIKRSVTDIQLGIWMITAAVGPLIYYTDGNWAGTLLWGTGISLMIWGAMRFGSHWDGIIYNAVQCLWLAVVLSQFLSYSADCWPTAEKSTPIVPLVLLMLATISAARDWKFAASGISVLFWIMLFLLGIVLLAGVPNLKGEYLAIGTNEIKASVLFSLLLPAAASFMPCRKVKISPLIMVAVIGTVIAIWVSGILSPNIASQVQWPFYEASRSVQLLNVAKRLEALTSAGVTIGNYALYSMLLRSARSIGDKFQKGKETLVIIAVISATLSLLEIVVAAEILILGSLILWIILPLFHILKRKENE